MGIFAYMQLCTQGWCKTGFRWHLIMLTMKCAMPWRCVPYRCIPNESSLTMASLGQWVPQTRVFDRCVPTLDLIRTVDNHISCSQKLHLHRQVCLASSLYSPDLPIVRDGSYGDKLTFELSPPPPSPTRNFTHQNLWRGGGREANTLSSYTVLYSIFLSLLKFDNFNHNYSIPFLFTLCQCMKETWEWLKMWP